MTWDFGKTLKLSSGPVKPPVFGEKVEWDVHSKQGVRLLRHNSAKKWTKLEVVVTLKTDNDEAGVDFAFHCRH
jgi:hypothetical protein